MLASELQIGDFVLLNWGDKFPLDAAMITKKFFIALTGDCFHSRVNHTSTVYYLSKSIGVDVYKFNHAKNEFEFVQWEGISKPVHPPLDLQR